MELDTFTYKAYDGTTDSNTATVNITINPINDPPIANNDYYNTNEDTTLNIPAPGILTNDTDTDGDTLTAYNKHRPNTRNTNTQHKRIIHIHTQHKLQRTRHLHIQSK